MVTVNETLKQIVATEPYNFVEVPDVAAARLLAPEAASMVWAELQRPPADCLIGDEDTSFEQHFLNPPRAQGNRKYGQTARAMVSSGKR
jgi:hypothetical protein